MSPCHLNHGLEEATIALEQQNSLKLVVPRGMRDREKETPVAVRCLPTVQQYLYKHGGS